MIFPRATVRDGRARWPVRHTAGAGVCPIHRTPLTCARCAGARGGKANVAKGFAVKPVSAAARKRAWVTRKRTKEESKNV